MYTVYVQLWIMDLLLGTLHPNATQKGTMQHAGMRIITGRLKTTSINTLETTRLCSLDDIRKQKIITYDAKLQRVPSQPALYQTEERTTTKKKTQKK